MFTMDTESGFSDAVFITSSYGLGEAVVQGAVNPDEFYVYKPGLREGRPAILRRGIGGKATKMIYTADPRVGQTTQFVDVPEADRRLLSLTDDEVTELARQALTIEGHYGRPMDIEWGKDGIDGKLYILQARPETVESRRSAGSVQRYRMSEKGSVLVEGRAIGQKIGAGPVRVLESAEQMHQFGQGEVLVADMTDPDWEPIMKRASAIVTNRGGRTCHAAIIARELGIPAVVGTGRATSELADGQPVTVSCAEGDAGFVYDGILDFRVESTELGTMPDIPVKIMMNVGTPDQAFAFSRIPNAGVGLARLEFIINRQIGIHPKALLDLDQLAEPLHSTIVEAVAAYPSAREFFVSRVAEGVATLAAAFAPHPVIVRMSDFKSNEYANLVGGELYEPHEENPMIGYRGASRYLSPDFAACFAMEAEALRYVRDDMGLTNVKIMIPFVRTLAEAEGVIGLLAEHGLRRGENELEVIMMCELPSNAVIADQFLDYFDGFSIGSNDMTQLTLGLDRDSALVAGGFDERDPAVKYMISAAIRACKKRGKYVGICGQGPSDHPDLAEWLVAEGIDTLSLNPDTVVDTWTRLAKLDARLTPAQPAPSGPTIHKAREVRPRLRPGGHSTAPAAWRPSPGHHRKAVDGGHLLGRQLDPYPGGIGSDALRAHRLRDHHEAVRDMPGDDHLRGRRIVFRGDRDQRRVPQVAHLERAVSLQHDSTLLQPGHHTRVVQRRTPPDLIDLRRHPGRPDQLIDLAQ